MRPPFRSSLTAVLAALAVGLSIADPAAAVVNGNAVTEQERHDKGLVALPSCSGVLLVNDWLLTAGHCVDQDRTNPSAITATMSTQTPDPARPPERADAVYLFGGFSQEIGPDLALVHLARPLTVNGSTSGFITRLWSGTKAQLAGKTVASYGRGHNMVAPATATTPATCQGGGFGPYRARDFTVEAGDFEPAAQVVAPTTTTFSSVAGGRYARLINPGNGMIAPGDSGGPSFVFEGGVPYLVGIHSSSNCPANAAHDVAIPAVRDWIVAVTASQWHPGVANEHVWVRQAEVAGTRWGLSDVNATGWAQAARAAAAMCYGRGFAGGHFEGHQSDPGTAAAGYGLQCSGPGTRWLNVTRRRIAATGWGFRNVNTVSWAQAGRAAERLCAGLGQGYAGGQFNGHMRNGRYGLFCYRTGAQWFDATAAQIAATGWGVTDVNTVSWAQAARAAKGFCEARGFSGGFMNGHQAWGRLREVPSRYGIVCQRA